MLDALFPRRPRTLRAPQHDACALPRCRCIHPNSRETIARAALHRVATMDPSGSPHEMGGANAPPPKPSTCDVKPRLTKEQHDVLEQHFQMQHKPSTLVKKDFASKLGVPLDKVNVSSSSSHVLCHSSANSAAELVPEPQGEGQAGP